MRDRMTVIPECGGFAAHKAGKIGETLVGWFESKNRAWRALDAYKTPPDSLHLLFNILGHIQAALLAEAACLPSLRI